MSATKQNASSKYTGWLSTRSFSQRLRFQDFGWKVWFWISGPFLFVSSWPLAPCHSSFSSAKDTLIRDPRSRKPRRKSFLDKALEDCKNWRQHWQISISFFRKILVAVNAFAWSLFDVWDDILTSLNMILREHPTLGGQHPIWGGLVLVIRFLPGIEWHSSKESLKGQHRLGWFLSCLFFPLTVISSRVRKHTIFLNLNLWF